VRRSQKTAILVVLGLAALYVGYLLRAVITPLLVALALAYILNPLLEALERRRVPRLAGVLAVYALLLGLVALFVFAGIPALVDEGTSFVREIAKPDAPVNKLVTRTGEYLKQRMGVENWEQMAAALKERMAGHWGEIAKTAGNVATEVLAFATSSLGAFLTVLGFVALVPVYLFFLLMNLNAWWERFTHAIPKAVRQRAMASLGRIHRANAAYFRGQTTIGAIEATIVFLTLWIAGAKLSLLFGLSYFFLCLIPFVGPFTWLFVTLIFTLIDTGAFGGLFIAVLILFAGVQLLESVVLQPLILGKETGLHPILITLALMSFGSLFGIFGMLIAVPLACALKILFEDYVWPMFAEVAELTTVRIKPETPASGSPNEIRPSP
jgi:predicted PurR-regulated permease PerM